MCSFASEENDSIEQVSFIEDSVNDVNMVNNELNGDKQIEQDNGFQQCMANEDSIEKLLVQEPVSNESVEKGSFFLNDLVGAKTSSKQDNLLKSYHIESANENESLLDESCHSVYDKLQRALASEQVQNGLCKGTTAHSDVSKLRISKFDNVFHRDNNVVKKQNISLKIVLCWTIKLLQDIFGESNSASKDKSTPYCVAFASFQAVTHSWSRFTPAGIG